MFPPSCLWDVGEGQDKQSWKTHRISFRPAEDEVEAARREVQAEADLRAAETAQALLDARHAQSQARQKLRKQQAAVVLAVWKGKESSSLAKVFCAWCNAATRGALAKRVEIAGQTVRAELHQESQEALRQSRASLESAYKQRLEEAEGRARGVKDELDQARGRERDAHRRVVAAEAAADSAKEAQRELKDSLEQERAAHRVTSQELQRLQESSAAQDGSTVSDSGNPFLPDTVS